jgi:microcystin-dependent protein
MRCYESLPYGWYLECTTAGTTGSSDITIPSPLDVGDTVTDGTVVWTIRKIGSGDGFAIGDIKQIAHNGTIQDGWLECDGRAVSRAMFADLFDAIGTTYGAGDGSTTFNLPNYSDGKFPEGSTVAGTVKQAGLPNIEGDVLFVQAMGYNDGNGAINATATSYSSMLTGSAGGKVKNLTIDASRSNQIYGNSDTVQPNALTVRYIIKAFDGVTPTPSQADISQILTELTNKADRALSNLSNDGKQTIIDYNMPDYDNGIDWSYPTADVDANYTAPDDGWVAYVITSMGGHPGKFALNNKDILYTTSSSSSYSATYGGLIRVSANDVITFCSMHAATTNPGWTALTFYPNKEVIA